MHGALIVLSCNQNTQKKYYYAIKMQGIKEKNLKTNQQFSIELMFSYVRTHKFMLIISMFMVQSILERYIY